nr:hypothetical protein [Bacillus pumilus]
MIRVYKYDENYVWEAIGEILVDVENGEEIRKDIRQSGRQMVYLSRRLIRRKKNGSKVLHKNISTVFLEVAPSDIEIVRQRQAEIVFTLMMKGVI